MTRAEQLQLQAAQDRLNAIWDQVPDELRADLAYVAGRIHKVLTGHASYR